MNDVTKLLEGDLRIDELGRLVIDDEELLSLINGGTFTACLLEGPNTACINAAC